MKKSLFGGCDKRKIKGIHIFCVVVIVLVMFVSSYKIQIARAREIARVEIDFNEKELAYMEQGKEIRLVNFVTRAPLSYQEDGELRGISIDIMRWIEVNTGLHFTYSKLPAGANPVDYITQGNAEVAVGVFRYGENLSNPDIVMTDPFFASDVVLVAKKGAAIDMSQPLKVLVSKGYRMGYQFLKDTYPNYEVEYADSMEEALRAVQKGNADLMFQSVYIVDEYLKRPSYSDLKLYKSSITQEELACAVLSGEDQVLVEILNKAIAAMPEEYTRQLIVDYTITRMYYPTISEQIANNPMLFAAIGVIIFGLIIMAFLFAKLHNRSKVMELMSQNEKYLKNITNNINGGLVNITKKDGFRITFANDRFWHVADSKNSGQKTNCLFLDFVCEEDQSRVEAELEKAWHDEKMLEIQFNIKNKDTKMPILLKGTKNSDLNGQQNITCVLIDFSREQALKEVLEDEKEMYRLFMEDSRDIVFYGDIETSEYTWPPFYEERFGVAPPQFIENGKEEDALKSIVAEEDIERFLEAIEELKSSKRKAETKVRLKMADHTYRWYRVKLSCMEKNAKVYRTLGRMTDIDKEVNRIQQLSDASMRDKLTGLYNKNAFYMLVKKYIEDGGEKGILLFLDLDNFKSVNDQMGHLAGDGILICVADSIKHIFRSDDIVSRFGGDEFIIFVKDSDETVAESKIQCLREEIERIKKECHAEHTGLAVCIGVSIYTSDARDVEQLVSQADEAMYHVKQNGKNGYAFYQDTKSSSAEN